MRSNFVRFVIMKRLFDLYKYGTGIRLLLILTAVTAYAQQNEISYSVAKDPWYEGLGSQRAVVLVEKPAKSVRLHFFWRRHDRDPADKRMILVNDSGDTIQNIYRISVDNEQCDLIFGPVEKSGIWYLYYLPFKVQPSYGGYRNDYLKPEPAPSNKWVKKYARHPEKLQLAAVREIQARTQFDSFYPMEIVPTADEKHQFLGKFDSEYMVFPESREFPIRMKDEIPLRWLEKEPGSGFEGTTLKNEYYVFQLGVYAYKRDVKDIRIIFSDLKSAEGRSIGSDRLTCFNTGGIDPDGNAFKRKVDVPAGTVQAFWIGVDVAVDDVPGTYMGFVEVVSENAAAQRISVRLTVEDKNIPDRGDSELWRLSRLRWLNSTLGIDNQVVLPYSPIEFDGNNAFRLSGHEIVLNEYGLPKAIHSKDLEILDSDMIFQIEAKTGPVSFSEPEREVLVYAPGLVSLLYRSVSGPADLNSRVSVESDGYMHFTLQLVAKEKLEIEDVRLGIPYREEVGRYLMGMGQPGRYMPDELDAKWGKGPYDSFWAGNTWAGLYCEFRGATYSGPLLNLYRPLPPESWDNGGKGGVLFQRSNGQVLAEAYTGSCQLAKGDTLEFEFALMVTPVKEIDYVSQFKDRYYHNGQKPLPSDKDLSSGIKIVNIHHANEFNPYINYPFLANGKLGALVQKLHAKGVKVKLYYTIRELTDHLPEIWALRSLGDEIFAKGFGRGYPWLREHLIDDYRPQWYQHFENGDVDASILTTAGESRWYNYYIEGLAWLVKNLDIDGLYLDDVAFDRRMLKRMRKAMDGVKPGCVLDLHSNTGFSKGPATQYMEYFPYLNKIWFGESFLYDKMPPDNWLVEVSGIPFGLMGDMLHAGGNPWRGMIYGMTVRYPWFTESVQCDPRSIWKVWDDFGIEGSEMIGYWEKNPVVLTTDPDVLATVYLKDGEMLVAIASWAEKPVRVSLKIDWDKTGMNPAKVKIFSPQIKAYQEERSFGIDEKIPVEPKMGWLLWFQEE